ncbi:FAD-dependent monooxygenase [Actinoplanes sp. NPDC051633]|uniref:FAD-dependent monooxygenase n=1 Tax=Actinoplanes sp. NPDC051633 TaxID=3155670 RepID=UPI003436551B
MPRPTSIAVIGGGIGGLAAALALLRAGFDVRVHEQARTLSDVGAGIQLAPNCTRILDRLGVLPAVERVAFAPDAIDFRRWDDGRLLSETPLGAGMAEMYGGPYLHAHRGDLVAVLAEAVTAERIETGRRCVGVSSGVSGARVHFADGGSADVDVVVGADGIHSVIRETLFGPERPRFTGHVAYRGIVPAERLTHLALEPRCSVRLGPGAHFVHYFISAGRLHNVVCVIEEPSWTRESWTDPGDPEELRRAFAGWHPVVGGIIELMDRPLKWALFDRPPLPSWSSGAVTLLGDACHPMLPYGAQGAAQAIEDAFVLASCLSGAGRGDLPDALLRYEAIRRGRSARVQELSRVNGHRFHLPDGPDQRARDTAMQSSFGISPEIDWLYGHDPLVAVEAGTSARPA